MLPVFVINLDCSVDRLARSRFEFARVGLAFERVAGVQGAAVPEHLRLYFCDGTGRVASRLNPGEVGYYASHMIAWERILAGSLPAALVL
jgi:glycosyl transferase family 25